MRPAVATGSTTNTHLGFSLAPCGTDVVAGALDGTVWRTVFLPGTAASQTVACRLEVLFRPLAGSATSVTQSYVANWSTFGTVMPAQLVSNRTGTFIAQRTSNGVVTVSLPNGTSFLLPWSSRIGLAWFDEQTLLGIGANDVQKAAVTTMGVSPTASVSLPSGLVAAGPAVVGVFGPFGVPQLALTDTQHRVWVLDLPSATPVMRLDNPSPAAVNGFGAALAVEQGWVDTVDGLFIGDPGSDQVWEFVGDAGVASWLGDPGSAAGASIAHVVGGGRDLYIGGPEASGGLGAVYRDRTPGTLVRLGDPMECQVGVPCIPASATCSMGECIGGVACVGSTTGCPPGFRCNVASICEVDPDFDAGVDASVSFDGGRDAGSDAGNASDAGPASDGGSEVEVDAGLPRDGGAEVDGGTGTDGGLRADAGATDGATGPTPSDTPYEFPTGCGCTAPPGGSLWMVLLSLPLLPRRRGLG